MRLRYFTSALYKVYQLPDIKSLGITYKAGVAGFEEHWNLYENILKKFAFKYPNIRMVLYCGLFTEKMGIKYQ